PGELLDKLTILQIKSERVQDPAKLRNVRYELAALDASAATIPPSDELAALISDLKQVNEAIWEAEDFLRAREKARQFDTQFIEKARSVYRNNDRRAAVKRRVNELLAAEFVEEKQHPAYE
ncbi:MAG: DUF6165 family protein, partial [Gemmataceae bacterium]